MSVTLVPLRLIKGNMLAISILQKIKILLIIKIMKTILNKFLACKQKKENVNDFLNIENGQNKLNH